jgi:hypothetical protein
VVETFCLSSAFLASHNQLHDVHEPSHRATGHQPQQPQNYQYYSNRP